MPFAPRNAGPMAIALLTGAAAVSAVLIAGCGLPSGDYFGTVDEHPDPTHLRWCNSGEPEYVDTGLVTSTAGLKMAYALFDGLTSHNLEGLPEPSLATSWTIDHDMRRFTFHLRRDGRWSNGEPITAHDFAYHIVRVLHPLTFSRNAEVHWKLKNGELFSSGRVKLVTADTGVLKRGDIVEIVGMNGEVATDLRKMVVPDSNLRTARGELALRDFGAPNAAAYARVRPGREVTIVEQRADDAGVVWAYVHRAEGDGVYGWVRQSQLTGQPNGDKRFTVRKVSRVHVPGVFVPVNEIKAELAKARPTAVAPGRDLLMTPDVLGLRVLADNELVLETWGPLPYMIDVTPNRAFRPTPRKAVSRWPLRWTEPDKIITSGPFHLTRWLHRDRIELVKSDTYWDRDNIKLERITSYNMDDGAASTNFYMTGGCDAMSSNLAPTSFIPVLAGAKRGGRPYKDYFAEPYLGIYFYLINTEKLQNVHFRRALSYAIDRGEMPKILRGGQTPSAQLMPGNPVASLSDDELTLCGITRDHKGVATIVETNKLCYVPPQGLSFDLDKAKQELALAKRDMGADFKTRFTVKFNTGSEGHKLVAENLQAQWKRNLGLTVTLQSQEWKTYLKATTSGEYEVARLGWIGNFPDPESEFLAIFKCDSPMNRTRWCNKEFDRLFKEAEATADRKQRLAIIKRAATIMINEAPVLPLYVYVQHHLQKPYMRDLAINLPDQVPLHKAWIDPDWKKHLADSAPARGKSN